MAASWGRVRRRHAAPVVWPEGLRRERYVKEYVLKGKEDVYTMDAPVPYELGPGEADEEEEEEEEAEE